MSVRPVMRLLLVCCLLLQVVTPLWACQHAADDPCHHCCHESGAPADSDGAAPACPNCVSHGQTWNIIAPLAEPVISGHSDRWRASREPVPPPVFPDSPFKPPILVATA